MKSLFIVYNFENYIVKTSVRYKQNILSNEKYWYASRNCPIKDISLSGGLLRNFLRHYE